MLRAASGEHLPATVGTLLESGLSCMEITYTVPDALTVIGALVDRYGESVCVGAGTVRTDAEAAQAIEAGAAYLVSPTFSEEVLARATAAAVPYLPGAMTPTEIARAWAAGAAAVKVFPAGVLGPRYLSAVREPMPEPPLVPSGALSIDDVGTYLRAGACAVSLGGALVGDALRGGSVAALRSRAEQVREHLAAGKGV